MEQTLKEKTLEHQSNGEAERAMVAEADGLDARILTALRAASDKKAVNPIVLDLREVADFTEFFVVTSGTNVRQVQAIVDGIQEELKKQSSRALRVEGYNTAEWILMDYGDFVVHVFEDKAREFYDLERLWRDARRLQLPDEFQNGQPQNRANTEI